MWSLFKLKAKWLTIKNFIEIQFPGRSTCATIKFHLHPPSSLMATLSTCLSHLGPKQLPMGVDFKPDIKQVPSLFTLIKSLKLQKEGFKKFLRSYRGYPSLFGE